MTLGIEFHAQQGKEAGPLLTSFHKVLDIILPGNAVTDIAALYSPVAKYRKWKAEK